MSGSEQHSTGDDRAPGAHQETGSVGIGTYTAGLGLAILLTIASFWAAGSGLIYGPGIPVALSVLGIAQMGVHLVFFLHMSSSPDNTNNIMALAFGVMVVGLVVGGSVWIMAHLNANMMHMPPM